MSPYTKTNDMSADTESNGISADSESNSISADTENYNQSPNIKNHGISADNENHECQQILRAMVCLQILRTLACVQIQQTMASLLIALRTISCLQIPRNMAWPQNSGIFGISADTDIVTTLACLEKLRTLIFSQILRTMAGLQIKKQTAKLPHLNTQHLWFSLCPITYIKLDPRILSSSLTTPHTIFTKMETRRTTDKPMAGN